MNSVDFSQAINFFLPNFFGMHYYTGQTGKKERSKGRNQFLACPRHVQRKRHDLTKDFTVVISWRELDDPKNLF
jgi:hypothetical protein